MTTLSAPSSGIEAKTRPAPRVVHGLAYGLFASLAMWGVIGAIVYKVM